MIAAPAARSLEGFVHSTAVDGVAIHCVQGGPRDGPPVLLWHGFLGTWYSWRKVAPLLAAEGYAVLVPDMRGYGDSAKPEPPDGCDGGTLANDFRGLVRETGFGGGRSVLLVAHDMGAPPALLYAARHPDEVAGLIYLDEPTLTPDAMAQAFRFTPQGTAMGGLWWWPLALAPDAVESLIVGKEREFLAWFHDHYAADRTAIEPHARDEVLRTFRGREGVLGAFGVYRAIFETIEQTAPLTTARIRTPVVALGGSKSIGPKAREMMETVAERVDGGAIECGHFIPEEKPEEVVRWVRQLLAARG